MFSAGSMFVRRLRPLMVMQQQQQRQSRSFMCGGGVFSNMNNRATSAFPLLVQQPTRLKSVLRKRKTKMNKHKHRKRLKKLRNKTKHGKRK
jgi:hypothetical protein